MNWLYRTYLRMRISAAERDVKYFEREEKRSPSAAHAQYFRDQATSARWAIAGWRIDLMISEPADHVQQRQ